MAARNKPAIASGITLLTEVEGQGPPAVRGDHVVFNMKIRLNRGDDVPVNVTQHLPEKWSAPWPRKNWWIIA